MGWARIETAAGRRKGDRRDRSGAHRERVREYRIVQDRLFESDFDRVVSETKRLGEGTPRKGKKPVDAVK